MKRWGELGVATLLVLWIVGIAPAEPKEQEAWVNLPIKYPDAFFGGLPWDGMIPSNVDEQTLLKPTKPEPILAPKDAKRISFEKPVSSSVPAIEGHLSQITDGEKQAKMDDTLDDNSGKVVVLPDGPQWVQIDLEATSEIYAVVIWNNYFKGRYIAYDVVIQVSMDPEFKKETITLFNSDESNSSGCGRGKDKAYFVNHWGKQIDTKGAKVRYVRLYSNGFCCWNGNNYMEVEVWGR